MLKTRRKSREKEAGKCTEKNKSLKIILGRAAHGDQTCFMLSCSLLILV